MATGQAEPSSEVGDESPRRGEEGRSGGAPEDGAAGDHPGFNAARGDEDQATEGAGVLPRAHRGLGEVLHLKSYTAASDDAQTAPAIARASRSLSTLKPNG